MLIIVKDTPLTENIKAGTYKYSGWFKIMNRISNLIQELEQIDKHLTQYDTEMIRKRSIEETIEYAKELTWKEKPFWKTGDIERVVDSETRRKLKRLK